MINKICHNMLLYEKKAQNTKHGFKLSNFNLLWFVKILVLCILFQSCRNYDTHQDTKVKYVIPQSLISKLKIDTIKKCPLVDALRLTGMVDFHQDKQVSIYSLVSGIVRDIKVQLGDHVVKGQILAIIKSSEMADYSYNLVVAETNLTATKKQLDATTDLFKSGLASSLDVTTAQVNYDQALSQLATAKKIIEINGNNENGEYIIKSPVNGFIVQKNVTNNTYIRVDNSTNLFSISDLRDVWVQANVYEADIEKVHLGDRVEVRVLSEHDKVFYGQVDQKLNVLEPSSKVIKVRIVLQNPEYILKPSMFASVIIMNQEGGQAFCVS